VNVKPETEISTTDTPAGAVRPSGFAPTRWTLVARARGETPEARAALSELCEAYYHPVFAFLRKERRGGDEARELTQEFFARILSGRGFAGADQARGRFRSYLLGALKHFLSEARQKAHRQKRGGGVAPESLQASNNTDSETADLQIADPRIPSPEASFDREWALEVMRRALLALDQEMTARRKKEQFEMLKPWLAGDGPSLSQAEAARKLGLSEAAVKVAVHRLRKRFGEFVRAEISQTLRDPAQADEELAHLIAALSHG
jgi:RNA polymerase sigma factor (sigma-70 family)